MYWVYFNMKCQKSSSRKSNVRSLRVTWLRGLRNTVPRVPPGCQTHGFCPSSFPAQADRCPSHHSSHAEIRRVVRRINAGVHRKCFQLALLHLLSGPVGGGCLKYKSNFIEKKKKNTSPSPRMSVLWNEKWINVDWSKVEFFFLTLSSINPIHFIYIFKYLIHICRLGRHPPHFIIPDASSNTCEHTFWPLIVGIVALRRFEWRAIGTRQTFADVPL